ncbi:MaoC family dehydratase [Limibacter armeniacum]|uniref:MaoC family dehydratase n=1 Tax=Limibacter armeniacum TaxID=466084 RepID=UPI002FE6B27F
MNRKVIENYEQFAAFEGKDLGESDYLKITQDQINKFAEATLDHQWIHTDPERAKKEGGFGNTIAHGYLTLSVVPYLWEQIVDVRNLKMLINYGIEKLRFNQPVVVGSELKLKGKMKSIANLRGITKCEIDVVMEIKDSKKPAFTGTIILLYHFND